MYVLVLIPQGDVVVTVSAYDGDRGVDDDIVYSLEDGNDLIGGNASFAIDNTTGVISVNAASLDRETHDMYTLRVQVRGRDQGWMDGGWEPG